MPLVKDQSSFYEIRSPAILKNIKIFNRVNRNSLNITKTFSDHLITNDDSVRKVVKQAF